VRYVLHHAPTESLDSYYQEVGRAGRDGAPAQAILLYRDEDFGLRRFLRGTGPLTTHELEEIAQALAHARAPVEAGALGDRLHLSRSKLTTAINRLQDAGEVETGADGRLRRPRGAPTVAKAVEAVTAAEKAREAFAESRLTMIRAYAEHDACRRQLLLSYFGEAAPDFCGHCDYCERLVAAGRAPRTAGDQPSAAGEAASEEGLRPGLRVRHPAWGEGDVQRVEREQVVVLFDTVGYKTLARTIVSERGLLAPVDRDSPADRI
jgi:ATP-dependent DNA helicase RecQ